MPKHMTADEKIKIVSYYKSFPMTYEDVSNKFGISLPSVAKVLKEYNVKPYTKVQLFSPDLDEHYFDNINTEEKAYFLGLLITDGCIHNTKGKQSLVSLTLKEQDEYLIDKFKECVKSNKTVTHDGRGCSGLNILSNIMVSSLKKYGICENKSLHTVFPTEIPLNMYRHLLRGIFDGDGSVSFYARPDRKSHTKAIRLCQGNEKFLIDIVNFLYDNCDIERVNPFQEKDSLWSIAYRKNDSMMKLYNYLYQDATIFMERKKKLCDLICTEIEK